MEKFNNMIDKTLMPIAHKMAANRYLIALRDGFVLTMPITIIGSFFLLVACFPIPAVSEALTNSGIADYLFKVTGATFDLLAIFVCLGISYNLAKSYKLDQISVAAMSLIAFFILTPNSTVAESGEIVGGALPVAWLGSKAIIVAMIVAIVSTEIFNLMQNKLKWIIKMPAGVPPSVSTAFTALIPGFVVITAAWLVYVAIDVASGGEQFLGSIVFTFLQVPLQNLTDSFFGLIAYILSVQTLWFFGIHGTAVVNGVVGPMMQANGLENLAMYQNGTLSIENGANIVTQQFTDLYLQIGGNGSTFGLILVMLFGGVQSMRYKQLGRLAAPAATFNINEPTTFGVPIVLNPVMLIPWILVPLINGTITYFAIYTGIMPPLNGLVPPWTTPVVISGLLVAGVRGALVQVVLVVIDAIIWFIFIRILDRDSLKDEELAEIVN